LHAKTRNGDAHAAQKSFWRTLIKTDGLSDSQDDKTAARLTGL
jgi:hypothetical protein